MHAGAKGQCGDTLYKDRYDLFGFKEEQSVLHFQPKKKKVKAYYIHLPCFSVLAHQSDIAKLKIYSVSSIELELVRV